MVACSGWVQEVAALPAEAQMKPVAAKLKDLSPSVDGKIDHGFQKAGVVTSCISVWTT